MKRLFGLLGIILAFMLAYGVFAGDSSMIDGEVLYHQDFSVESRLCESGIRIGTQSSENSEITCKGDTLEIKTFDRGRVYAILPDVVRDAAYTVEFSFRFTEIGEENGFISLILTCRGEEPTNISDVVIRANGTVDEFDVPCDMVKRAIRSGELVNVQIPVRNQVVNEIIMTAGEYQCVVERDNILVISDGQMGFSVRNASVELPEIYVVHGVDYAEKSGYFTDSSYSEEGGGEVVVPKPSETAALEEEASVEISPDTGDGTAALLMLAVGGGAIVSFEKRRKNR